MKRQYHRLALLVAAGCALAGARAAPAQDIEWRYDYNRARQEAIDKSRPLMIDFVTVPCVYCTKLENETFVDPEVRRLLNERFIPLKIDGGRSPDLAEKLNIKRYPTLVYAASDGRILGFQEGFLEAARLRDQLVRSLAAVATPEWMVRDYQDAVRCQGTRDFAKAVSLLKNIAEDGKERPVQVKSRQLLQEIENQAAALFAQAQASIDKGQTARGVDMLNDLVKQYPGTPAAREAVVLIQTKVRNDGGDERGRRSRDLLARAREDYKAQLYLCCLDRCEVLISSYSDLSEATDAAQLAQEIRSNPEWTKMAADQVSDRLCLLYLNLADTWLKRGQPRQATYYLERVIQLFPNTRHAEIAQIRLSQIQGIPSKTITDFKR